MKKYRQYEKFVLRSSKIDLYVVGFLIVWEFLEITYQLVFYSDSFASFAIRSLNKSWLENYL